MNTIRFADKKNVGETENMNKPTSATNLRKVITVFKTQVLIHFTVLQNYQNKVLSTRGKTVKGWNRLDYTVTKHTRHDGPYTAFRTIKETRSWILNT